jgi:AcrR family transcriptional regulator
MRSDATANRERILAAATAAVRREGERVPMATIAAEAGVGIGTLYRHYPTRAALLSALTMHSFSVVLEQATRAATSRDPAPHVLARFLEETIAARDRFILPFHGGPDIQEEEILAARAEIRRLLGEVLERGRQEGSIRPDVTPLDIIITGAMLAQPLPNVADWDELASRHAQTFVAGISA